MDNDAESREVQELFFELGYNWFKKGYMEVKTPETIMSFENGALSTGIRGSINHKEITLPELRDLVVLKRNDVGDASHINCNGQYMYEASSGDWYLYHNNAWKSDGVDIDDMPKPIEKPMKEYLRKNNDGEYILEVTDEREAQEPHAKHWIEIPERADIYAISKNWKESIFFAKSGGDTLETFNTTNKNDWHQESTLTLENLEINYSILWQRHTHPEELPFIDDEPSINDQYAEIEKVRQSHRTASEIADSALKHIRERAETYDQPTGERSAAKTAKAFNAITGKDITESEVWLLLQLLKDVRQWSREDYHQDSAEDCIAYAALKAESLEGGE